MTEKKPQGFKEYIREKRLNAGLSLRKAALGLGVSHVYLREVELGRRAPFSAKYWDLLAKTIGADVDKLLWLFTEERPVKVYLEGMNAKDRLDFYKKFKYLLK